MRTALLAVLLLISLACSSQAQQSGDVAARVGDRAITVKELDERWQKEEPAQKAQAEQAIYDGRKTALDAIIADMLVEQAAKAKGMTADAYVQAEVDKRKKPVNDTDVRNFYVQNSERMQGRSFEQMSGAIQRYLADQAQNDAKESLIAELRKAGPPIRVVMDAPRTPVSIAADDPSQGKADAPVTVVEFSDFQCPFCLRANATVDQVLKTYGDKIHFVYRHYPLPNHPNARPAAEASACAAEQGQFWPYHDRLFEQQSKLSDSDLKTHAAALGLDTARFNACFDAHKYKARVDADMQAGNEAGVNGTPAFFINGRLLSGAQPFDEFKRVIDEELARR